jgi:hypothetical protein
LFQEKCLCNSSPILKTGKHAMTKQPDIPETPNTPATATGNPPAPSRYLNQGDAGMVSQADVQDVGDEKLERDRRENINPSLAREQPDDTGEPPDGSSGGSGQ